MLYSQVLFPAGTLLQEAQACLDSQNYKRAVELSDSVLRNSANTDNKIRAIDILTKATYENGSLADTERYYREGMSLFDIKFLSPKSKSRDEDLDYQKFIFNYAHFLLNVGRYDDCLELAKNLDFSPESDAYLKSRGLQSAALMRKGDYQQSLEILDSTLASGKNTLPTYPILLQNRGFLYLQTRDYTAALRDIKSAVELTEGLPKIIALSNEAVALAGLGRTEEALDLIDSVLDLFERNVGKNHVEYTVAFRKKAEILAMSGRRKEALSDFKSFYSLECQRLLSLLPSLSPTARLNYWKMSKPALSHCFEVGEEDPQFAFEVALMRRETSLLASRTRNFELDLKSGLKTVRKSLKPKQAAVAFITYPSMSGKENYAAVVTDSSGDCHFVSLWSEDFLYDDYSGGRSIYDFLVSEDPKDKNELYRDVKIGNKIWQPILSKLPEDISTIHFAPEGAFHLWGIENMPYEGNCHPELVRHFSLYDIDKTDNSNVQDILLIGGLDYDDVTLGDSVKQINDKTNAGETSLLDGNKSASEEVRRSLGKTDGIFQFLPGTQRETADISLFLPEAQRVSHMTEEEFKVNSKNYNVIHLATHGYALDCGLGHGAEETDNQGYDLTLLRSGLALTGANKLADMPGREDGIISAREICDLDLRDVEIVVLSACQTAKGRISDESASGLIRALKIAGVRTVVAALWEVDDNSTAMFMANFHKELSRTGNRYEAFEKAKIQTAAHRSEWHKRKFDAGKLSGRKTEETVVSQPFAAPWYWAPFVIVDP